MSQLAKRNSVSLRREWRLFDRDHANPEAFLKLCERMVKWVNFCSPMMWQGQDLKLHPNHKSLAQRAAHALCKAGSPLTATLIWKNLYLQGLMMWKHRAYWQVLIKTFVKTPIIPRKKQEYADLAIARYEQAYLGKKSMDPAGSGCRQPLLPLHKYCLHAFRLHELRKGPRICRNCQ